MAQIIFSIFIPLMCFNKETPYFRFMEQTLFLARAAGFILAYNSRLLLLESLAAARFKKHSLFPTPITFNLPRYPYGTNPILQVSGLETALHRMRLFLLYAVVNLYGRMLV
jgi:hypothetical protein